MHYHRFWGGWEGVQIWYPFLLAPTHPCMQIQPTEKMMFYIIKTLRKVDGIPVSLTLASEIKSRTEQFTQSMLQFTPKNSSS